MDAAVSSYCQNRRDRYRGCVQHDRSVCIVNYPIAHPLKRGYKSPDDEAATINSPRPHDAGNRKTCQEYVCTELMSPPLSRRKVLAVSASVGSSCLAGCQGQMSSATPSASDESGTDEGKESLGLAFSKSRTSFPSESEAHSGWVHIVSDGESADLIVERPRNRNAVR